MQTTLIAEMMIREKHGIPENWKAFQFECLGNPTSILRMKGGVAPPKKTGKNKGRPNYAKAERVVEDYITFASIEEWGENYEKTTGICNECMGEGKVMQSWHYINGTTYRPCTRCNGTGRISNVKAVVRRERSERRHHQRLVRFLIIPIAS